MMKQITVLVLLFTCSCFAQIKKEKENNGFFGSVGFSGSVTAIKKGSQLKSNWFGTTVSAAGGYIFNNNIALRSEFNYSSFSKSFSKSDTNEIFNALVIKGEMLLGTFKPNAKVDIYGIAGGGYYAFTQNENRTLYESKKESNFGAVVGAGISYRIHKKLCLNWEAQYNIIFNNSNVNGYFSLSAINLAYIP
jgi:opacity protein-like surface antigen